MVIRKDILNILHYIALLSREEPVTTRQRKSPFESFYKLAGSSPQWQKKQPRKLRSATKHFQD